MAVTARARFVHVMRGWAADEAMAIEQMVAHPVTNDSVTAADKHTDDPKASRDAYVDRMVANTNAQAERRWAFVEAQCAKHGVSLGQ